jgi:hypothetical protein
VEVNGNRWKSHAGAPLIIKASTTTNNPAKKINSDQSIRGQSCLVSLRCSSISATKPPVAVHARLAPRVEATAVAAMTPRVSPVRLWMGADGVE